MTVPYDVGNNVTPSFAQMALECVGCCYEDKTMSCKCAAVSNQWLRTRRWNVPLTPYAAVRVAAFGISIALLAFLGAAAHAASLGKFVVMSQIGQPFHGEIDVVKWNRQELDALGARLASAESHRQAGLQYSPALQALKFNLAKRRSGQPYIKVTSSRPVDEPVVDLLVELAWHTGASSHAYTVLIDPPGEKVARAFPGRVVASDMPLIAGTQAKRAPAAPQSELAKQVRLKEEQAVVQKHKLAAAQERISELEQTIQDQEKLLAPSAAAAIASDVQTARVSDARRDAAAPGIIRTAHESGQTPVARAAPTMRTERIVAESLSSALGEPLYLGAAGVLLLGTLMLVILRRRRKEG